MKRLLSKSQAAKRAGVDRAIITRKTKDGEELFPALVDGKIDAGHPAFLQFLKDRNVDPATADLAPQEQKDGTGFPDDGSPQVPVDIQELTIREIGERFGGNTEFSEWLKAIKLAEEIREKRLKNDATDGSMISRDLVTSRVFAYIEEIQRRLLTDSVKTMTRQTYASARGGVEIEQCERDAAKVVTGLLKPLQTRVARNLRDAAPYGYESESLATESS